MRGLLQLPEVLRKARHGGRRVEDDLGAVKAQEARAFGEVAVVADVDADRGVASLEGGIAEVTGLEVELLPEAGEQMRDVLLAELAEVAAVRVDDRGSVVVDAGHLLFVDGHDDDHLVGLGQLPHQGDGRAIRDALGHAIPAGILLGGEVGAVEDLLEAEDLNALAARFVDLLHMLVDHRLLDTLQRLGGIDHVRGLDQAAFHDSGHRATFLTRRE
ncbi:hypothetical protein D3C72_210870 [compost metagenome]